MRSVWELRERPVTYCVDLASPPFWGPSAFGVCLRDLCPCVGGACRTCCPLMFGSLSVCEKLFFFWAQIRESRLTLAG